MPEHNLYDEEIDEKLEHDSENLSEKLREVVEISDPATTQLAIAIDHLLERIKLLEEAVAEEIEND